MNVKHNIGGSAIASGGFGCVFNPSLKCENKKRDKDKISKLMIEKYAYKEYDEIKIILSKLKSIKNYQNYFLINDIQICKPSKLTSQDLKNYFAWNNILKDLNLTNVPLWLSGHTHWSYDILYNKNTSNIRLISNQLGYKREIGFTNIVQDGLFEIDL